MGTCNTLRRSWIELSFGRGSELTHSELRVTVGKVHHLLMRLGATSWLARYCNGST